VKILDDFGVRALFGTIVLLGTFILLGILAWQEKLEPVALVGMMGSWVTGIVTIYVMSKPPQVPPGPSGL
jgi:hypothetical protein